MAINDDSVTSNPGGGGGSIGNITNPPPVPPGGTISGGPIINPGPQPPPIDNRPPGGGLPGGGGFNPGGPTKPTPPTRPTGPVPPPTGGGPGQQPPGDGGGGCPCPGTSGGGGDPGGGGTPGGSGGQTPPQLCKKHDGTVVDTTGGIWTPDPDGLIPWGNDGMGGGGIIDPANLPYCDDQPCPDHPAVEDGTKCCKEAFQAIADAMKEISKALDKKFELTQEMIDKWLDYIAKKIKDKIIPPAKTCEECCKRIEIGLATQAECAMVAANCTCQACVDSCESFNEGECCKNCGSTNCKCKEGKCVGDDKPPQKKWTAWCDHSIGVTLSTDDGNPPTSSGTWTNMGTFDTQSQADAVSCSTTDTDHTPGTGGGGPSLPPVKLPDGSNMQGVCESDRYRSRTNATNFLQHIPSPNVEADIIAGVRTSVSAMSAAGGNVAGMSVGAMTGLAQTVGRVWMIDVASNILAGASGAAPSVIYPAIRTLGTIGIAEDLCGISLPQLHVGIEYALNAAIRPRLYTPEQALAAGLSHRIEMDDVDRYFAAAGYCEEVSRGMIQAEKSKPSVAELARMRRRKMITDDEYTQLVRTLGYIDDEWSERLFKLTEALPGPAEIVRFMQRDVEDSHIVDRFKLDDEFDDKYTGKVKEWAANAGVPDEVMKRFWRAHWDIPSPTALTEMFRRLRYDDVPADQKVSIDDVRTALVQQDILPTWVEKYIALMHPPLGRIDIRRSYQNGTLTDDETKRALGELGYSDGNVDKLFKFMQKLKEQGASNHRMIKRWVALLVDRPQVQSEMQDDGYTADQIDKALETASPRLVSSIWAKAYVNGEISEVDFRNLLTGHGVTGDSVGQIVDLLAYKIKDTATIKAYTAGILTRQSALDRMTNRGMLRSSAQHELDIADDTFNAAQSARCAANVKSRYVRGALDADEAKSKLIVNGVASEWADRLIGKWKCELASKDKSVTADKLCGWVARGSIDVAELKQRLVRLGYTESDALNLVGDCADRIATQQAKAEAKRQREAETAKSKAASTARHNESRANALIRQAEQARKAKNQLRQTRQVQELSTLKNLITKCDCTDSTAVAMFQSNKDRITSQLGLTTDEANRVLLKASEVWSDGKPESFPPVVDELARVLSTTEVEALTPEP